MKFIRMDMDSQPLGPKSAFRVHLDSRLRNLLRRLVWTNVLCSPPFRLLSSFNIRNWNLGIICACMNSSRNSSPYLPDNIKMDPGQIASGGEGWISLIQDWEKWRSLVSAVMNSGSIKCWEIIEWWLHIASYTHSEKILWSWNNSNFDGKCYRCPEKEKSVFGMPFLFSYLFD
jgi:hypothetical protein